MSMFKIAKFLKINGALYGTADATTTTWGWAASVPVNSISSGDDNALFEPMREFWLEIDIFDSASGARYQERNRGRVIEAFGRF